MIDNQKKTFDGESKLRLSNELENLAEQCGLEKKINSIL